MRGIRNEWPTGGSAGIWQLGGGASGAVLIGHPWHLGGDMLHQQPQSVARFQESVAGSVGTSCELEDHYGLLHLAGTYPDSEPLL